MDVVEPILGVLIPIAAAGGYLLGHRKSEPVERVDAPVEVQGIEMQPQGGHKHEWNTMLSDGRGWVCGVPVAPGVICGWSREFGKGGPTNG